jgi:hypothetical protein
MALAPAFPANGLAIRTIGSWRRLARQADLGAACVFRLDAVRADRRAINVPHHSAPLRRLRLAFKVGEVGTLMVAGRECERTHHRKREYVVKLSAVRGMPGSFFPKYPANRHGVCQYLCPNPSKVHG